MDAGLETTELDRTRKLIPSIAVVTVVAAVITLFSFMNREKAPSAGDGGKVAAAGGVTAAGAASAGEKKGSKDEKKEKAPVPVNVTEISTGAISSYISATANLVAENEVRIIGEAEGRVTQLLVEEGDVVQKGQTLAVLNRDDAEILIAKSKVRAENAGVAFNRAKEMYNKDLMSKGDYEKTEMEKSVAEQELAEAQWRYSKTTIRAPFAGRVTSRKIQVGTHVRPGEELFTVTDYDPLIALIYIPETDVLALEEGREVRLNLKADEGVAFKGRISQISPVVDTATGTVKVKVEAIKPPKTVRPGSFVSVNIIRETRGAAVLLPREAVIRELRDAHVFVTDGNKATKRVIQLGIEEGTNVQVLSGVKAGEKVIIAGQGGLKDGSPIKVLDTPKKS
ncbi:MAG: efflux RND transporter periplasmic adaptor subunit [Thermoanaerobaculia bacterium]